MMYEVKRPRSASLAEAIARNVRATEIGYGGIGTFRAYVDLFVDTTLSPEDLTKLERAFEEKLAVASKGEKKLNFAPGCRAQLNRGLTLIRDQMASAADLAA